MHLLFDFDGTLADCSPGIYASFQLACTSLNLETPAFHIFRHAIGPPVQKLAQGFFPDLSTSGLKAFRQIFREDYDQHRFRQCDWYEDVKSTIPFLAGSVGTTLSIVTNKPTNPTLELVKAAGLLRCFQLVVGIDYQITQGSGPVFASKADAIRLAQSHLASESSSAVYIGDTPSDRDASHACGLPFIAATYGFHRWLNSELLNTTSITAISELVPLLEQSTSNTIIHRS